MSECKHGLEEAWCVICKGSVVINMRSPTVEMCCAPDCQKASFEQVGPLPLCQGHILRLESHVAKVHLVPYWEELQKSMSRPLPGEDWVYFVRIGDAIKIGHSTRLTARLRSFAAYGQEVEVLALELGGRDLEARLHRRFGFHRAKVGLSKELFEPVEELLHYIEKGRRCALCDIKAKPGRVVCGKHRDRADYETEEALIGVQLHALSSAAQ